MTTNPQETNPNDWDTRSPDVQADQVAAYDAMRSKCPVAHDDYMGYSLLKNADIKYALEHPEIFSNKVSTRHIAVPNGMDAPEHTAFRAVNDKYFTPDRMQVFEPQIRQVVKSLVSKLPRNEVFDAMDGFAQLYAVRIQNVFMGWPASLEQPLIEWVEKNRRATLAGDREEMGKIALEFDGYIRALLDERRGADAAADITAELIQDVIDLPQDLGGPRTMTDEELISLIRNWTVGELSTVSACAGIILAFLAEHPQEQDRLRTSLAVGKTAEIAAAVEEVMRLQDPLVTNRRVTTQPVEIGGRSIPAGARVTINWASANRDEDAFEDATTYNPHRSQENNLVYGQGLHVCPGAPLARLELRVLMEELLAATDLIEFGGANPTQNAVYPAAGYSKVLTRIS